MIPFIPRWPLTVEEALAARFDSAVRERNLLGDILANLISLHTPHHLMPMPNGQLLPSPYKPSETERLLMDRMAALAHEMHDIHHELSRRKLFARGEE